MKHIFEVMIIGLMSGFAGAFLFTQAVKPTDTHTTKVATHEMTGVMTGNAFDEDSGLYSQPTGPSTLPEDFVTASEISTQSVIYVRNISQGSYGTFLDYFFGGEYGRPAQVSTGSGVIFTTDGYIVTNNHVVEGADKLEVQYNKNSYPAEIIGTDPSSDLAVLKIDARNLPPIPLGNSKNVHVGEWVLAVGNPFNLTSTVTAGIVSAKGRDINILQEKFPLESFIQTDAAINPGNSGGALVNKKGELVGINTAILSKTGSYTGYGFAVPVDIVKKVFYDIKTYGEVQKAFYGGEVEDFNSEMAKNLDITITDNNFNGVVLVYIQKDGAAKNAGLKEGDIITAIDDQPINTRSLFEEELSYRSPGDEITLRYLREGKTYHTRLALTNREGTTDILKRKVYASVRLGANFEEVSKVEREALGIENGVRVFDISRGQLSGMEEDFVITHINRTPINSAEKLIDILENLEGIIWIEGVDKEGRRGRYRFYGG